MSQASKDGAIDTAQDREARLQRGKQATLRQRWSTLTPREREALPLVMSGLLNKQAAAELGISEVTLQIHRGRIMHKMEAGSFAELVRMAGPLGIPLMGLLVAYMRQAGFEPTTFGSGGGIGRRPPTLADVV